MSDKVICHGIKGTDSKELDCKVDTKKRMITIKDACKYQKGNPGTMAFMFETLRNPDKNEVTDSFVI